MKITGMAFLFLFATIFAIAVYAADYYTLANGADQDITEHSVCKNIDNNGGATMFIPTKTSGEWTSLHSNPPSGVTIGDCCSWIFQSFQSPAPGYGSCGSPCTCGNWCEVGPVSKCSGNPNIDCSSGGTTICIDAGAGFCLTGADVYQCN